MRGLHLVLIIVATIQLCVPLKAISSGVSMRKQSFHYESSATSYIQQMGSRVVAVDISLSEHTYGKQINFHIPDGFSNEFSDIQEQQFDISEAVRNPIILVDTPAKLAEYESNFGQVSTDLPFYLIHKADRDNVEIANFKKAVIQSLPLFVPDEQLFASNGDVVVTDQSLGNHRYTRWTINTDGNSDTSFSISRYRDTDYVFAESGASAVVGSPLSLSDHVQFFFTGNQGDMPFMESFSKSEWSSESKLLGQDSTDFGASSTGRVTRIDTDYPSILISDEVLEHYVPSSTDMDEKFAPALTDEEVSALSAEACLTDVDTMEIRKWDSYQEVEGKCVGRISGLIVDGVEHPFQRLISFALTRPIGSQSRRMFIETAAGYADLEAEQMDLLSMAMGEDKHDAFSAWMALYSRAGVSPSVLEKMAAFALDQSTDITLFDDMNVPTIHIAAVTRQTAIASRIAGRIAALGPLDSFGQARLDLFSGTVSHVTECFFKRLNILEQEQSNILSKMRGNEQTLISAVSSETYHAFLLHLLETETKRAVEYGIQLLNDKSASKTIRLAAVSALAPILSTSSPMSEFFKSDFLPDTMKPVKSESMLISADARLLSDDVRRAFLKVIASDDESAALRTQMIRAFSTAPASSLDDLLEALGPTIEAMNAALDADPNTVFSPDISVLYSTISEVLKSSNAHYHYGVGPKEWELHFGKKVGFYAGAHAENTVDATVEDLSASGSVVINNWAKANAHAFDSWLDIVDVGLLFDAQMSASVMTPVSDVEGPKPVIGNNRIYVKYLSKTVVDRQLINVKLSGDNVFVCAGGQTFNRVGDDQYELEGRQYTTGEMLVAALNSLNGAGQLIYKNVQTTRLITLRYPIGPIVVTISVTVGATVSVNYDFNVDFDAGTASGMIQPEVYATVSLRGSASLIIVRGGVELDAVICHITVVPSATASVLEKPLSACITIDVNVIPLSIQLYAFVEFRVCFKCHCRRFLRCKCSLNWCHKKSISIFKENIGAIKKRLQALCKGDQYSVDYSLGANPISNDFVPLSLPVNGGPTLTGRLQFVQIAPYSLYTQDPTTVVTRDDSVVSLPFCVRTAGSVDHVCDGTSLVLSSSGPRITGLDLIISDMDGHDHHRVRITVPTGNPPLVHRAQISISALRQGLTHYDPGINNTLGFYVTPQAVDGQGQLSSLNGVQRVLVRVPVSAGTRSEISLYSGQILQPNSVFTQLSVQHIAGGQVPVMAEWTDFFAASPAPPRTYTVYFARIASYMASSTLSESQWPDLRPFMDTSVARPLSFNAGQFTDRDKQVYRARFTGMRLTAGYYYAACIKATDYLGRSVVACSSPYKAVNDISYKQYHGYVSPGVVLSRQQPRYASIDNDPDMSPRYSMKFSFTNDSNICATYSVAIARADKHGRISLPELQRPTGSAWSDPLKFSSETDGDEINYLIYSADATRLVTRQNYVGLVRCWQATGVPVGIIGTGAFQAGLSQVTVSGSVNFGQGYEGSFEAIDPIPLADDKCPEVGGCGQVKSSVSLSYAPYSGLVDSEYDQMELLHLPAKEYLNPNNTNGIHAFDEVPRSALPVSGMDGVDCSYRMAFEAYIHDDDADETRRYDPHWAPPAGQCITYEARTSGDNVAIPAVLLNGVWVDARSMPGYNFSRDLSAPVSRFSFCATDKDRRMPEGLAICRVPLAQYAMADSIFSIDRLALMSTCDRDPIQVALSSAVNTSEVNVVSAELIGSSHGTGVSAFQIKVFASTKTDPKVLAHRMVNVTLRQTDARAYVTPQQLYVNYSEAFRTPSLPPLAAPSVQDYCNLSISVQPDPISSQVSQPHGIHRFFSSCATRRETVWRVDSFYEVLGDVTVVECAASASIWYTATLAPALGGILVLFFTYLWIQRHKHSAESLPLLTVVQFDSEEQQIALILSWNGYIAEIANIYQIRSRNKLMREERRA